MTNNEIFNTLLHLTGLSKEKNLIIHIFAMSGFNVSYSKVKAWRTEVDNIRASRMPDAALNAFFQGLFAYRDLKIAQGINVFNFSALEGLVE